MTKPTSPHSDTASKAHRQTSARSEQAAFQAAVKPHLQELFEAARRELRYRVALGDFGPDLLTGGGTGWRDTGPSVARPPPSAPTIEFQDVAPGRAVPRRRGHRSG
jgi:hypothetical protein